MQMRLLSILLVEVLLHSACSYNYCQNTSHLCVKSRLKHFICDLSEELHPFHNRAKYLITVPNTDTVREFILDHHNRFRDMTASGTLQTNNHATFPPASRMRELIWDKELAYTARIHAETVSFKHTLCRSVVRFPYVGENLSLIFGLKERRSLEEILGTSLESMFDEYLDIEDPADVVENLQFVDSPNGIGHLTIIISDRVSRVGCALVIGTNCLRSDKDGYCFFLTCHYDFTNIVGSYVYRQGPSTTKCNTWGTGPSSKFHNLCGNSGALFHSTHGDPDDVPKRHNYMGA